MNKDIILKYNRPGPRYTSYPPATFFSDSYTNREYQSDLEISNNHKPDNISLYVHIPFCPQLCHFCGCNTSHVINEEFTGRYVDAVVKEIDTVAALLDKNRKVTQIHWGGGTPNSIQLSLVEKIMDRFAKHFSFADKSEIAMECNPAYLEFDHILSLKKMGFNRLSLGIQDLNENVLNIVNRLPSKYPVAELVKFMKTNGFDGVNLDLIYGLPLQTPESFGKTIDRIIEISPDRLVTFSYAHVPWVKGVQKKLEEAGLPGPDEKLSMFITSYNKLIESGYIAIGMDHYAKKEDDLSVALINKKLHRNFQGYCTKETTGQVYGFGSTSITQLNGAYIQNIKETRRYVETIEKNDFAVEKGFRLSKENLIVRHIINEIMCNGYLNLDETAKLYNTSIDEIISITGYHPSKLEEFTADNLLEVNGNVLQLKNNGFLVVRNIAMVFDPLLEKSEARYSKTV